MESDWDLLAFTSGGPQVLAREARKPNIASRIEMRRRFSGAVRALASAVLQRGRGQGLRQMLRMVRNKQRCRNEGREIRTPNLLIWSQTRCRCAIPPLLHIAASCAGKARKRNLN